MKNTLTYQNSIQHLLSNVDDGTNKLIVDGIEIPSSTWEGTGTFTITSGSATITIEQIENASNIMLQKVSTNNYKLVDAGAAGKVNLESNVTGTLPIGNGGTGSSAGDSKDLIATFTSADDDSIFNSGNLGAQSAYAWNAVSKIDSGEKHSSLFNKISTMFKNIRTIAKFLGTTDISAIGGGTVSGAIYSLNNSLSNKQATLTFTILSANINVSRNSATGQYHGSIALSSFSGYKANAKAYIPLGTQNTQYTGNVGQCYLASGNTIYVAYINSLTSANVRVLQIS